MVELEVVRNINASTESVWQILGDYGNLSWVPGADNVEVEGEGIGMIRRLFIPGVDTPIEEVLTAKNESANTFSYRIPKNDVIPFDDYTADVSVDSTKEGSTVVWKCSFDEGQMAQADAKDMIGGSYKMMLDALAEKLEA